MFPLPDFESGATTDFATSARRVQSVPNFEFRQVIFCGY
ncbi:hypothetical protein CCP3SC1AL1_20011 [Gammaproteobacteria bacterium]